MSELEKFANSWNSNEFESKTFILGSRLRLRVKLVTFAFDMELNNEREFKFSRNYKINTKAPFSVLLET